MWNIMQVYQLSKVGIDRDQHPPVRFCELQQCPVSWVRAKLPGFDNVVSVTAKPLSKTSTCAAIHQESHDPSTDTAARESPAMTACA